MTFGGYKFPERKTSIISAFTFTLFLLLSISYFTEVFLPSYIFEALISVLKAENFVESFLITAQRVLISVGIVFVVGTLLLLAEQKNQYLADIIQLTVVFPVYAVPSLLWALVVVMLLGLSPVSTIVILSVISSPYFFINMREAIKEIDHDLLEVGQVFGVQRFKQWRYVLIPVLLPRILSALRILSVFCWKAVVLAEFLSASSGVGYNVQLAFSMGNLKAVVGWGSTLMIAIIVFELGIRLADRQLRKHLYHPS